jgi:TRAP-type C4-dicarboxylate transport system permease small subunit
MKPNRFDNIVNRVIGAGVVIGSCFLIGLMLLMVTNIIIRLFGVTIQGAYEMSELIVVVPVAFGLGYTALYKGHVVINIIASRLSPLVRKIVQSFTLIVGAGIWAVVFWASVELIPKKVQLGEQTEVLGFPYLPFRIIWVIGLALLCLVLLYNLFRLLSQGEER